MCNVFFFWMREWNINVVFLLFLAKSRACFWCCHDLSLLEKIKRCGSCELFAYCSKQCQKKHWKKVHRHSCKEFAEIFAKDQKESNSEGSVCHCDSMTWYERLKKETISL